MEQKISWPGWEVVRLIGRGSFGGVYEIRRELPGGRVERAALKVLTIPEDDDEIIQLKKEYDDASITAHFKGYLEEIIQEYSLMLDLKGHTNVVYCDDLRHIQHDDGIGWDIYIKMELLTPLNARIGQTYDEAQTLRLGMDMCKALILCQEHGIVHRDIKPANIFVSRDGNYKLGDFGVAKVTEKTATGTKVGTYEYMAPEVYRGLRYGAGADIYSLGLVLYWMMNDKFSPFLSPRGKIPTNTEKETARNRRFAGESVPAPRHGSRELQRIVLKACAYRPEDRYLSAQQMLEDLQRIAQPEDATIRERTVRETDRSTAQPDPEKTVQATSAVSAPVLEPVRIPKPAEPAKPAASQQKVEQGNPYRQTGGTREQVGNLNRVLNQRAEQAARQSASQQSQPYGHAGTGVKEQVGAARQQPAKEASSPYRQTGGAREQVNPQKTPPQTDGASRVRQAPKTPPKQTATQTTAQKTAAPARKKASGWVVVLIGALVLALCYAIVAAADGFSAWMDDQDTQDQPQSTDSYYDSSTAVGTLTENLYYVDGSYMEIYCDENGNQVRRDYWTGYGLEYRVLAGYDDAGNRIAQTVYHNDQIDSQTEWAYDDAGNLIRKTVTLGDGSVYRITRYTRDGNGNAQRVETTDGAGNLLNWTYNNFSDLGVIESYDYDGNDNRLAYDEYIYYPDGEQNLAQLKSTYEDGTQSIWYYDTNGYNIGWESYDENGVCWMSVSYALDENGRTVSGERVELYNGVQTVSQEIYTRDSLGYQYRTEYLSSDATQTQIEWVDAIDGTGLKSCYYGTDGYSSVTVYDGKGNPVEYTAYQDGGLNYREVTTYNESGLAVERLRYDSNDALEETCRIAYDDRGNQLTEETYDATGRLADVYEYVYTEDGVLDHMLYTSYYEDGSYYWSLSDADWNTLQSISYEADGTVSSKTEYARDELGRAVERRSYDAEGLTGWTRYEYDDTGRLWKEAYYDADAGLTDWTEIIYREDGQEHMRINYDAGGTKIGWTEYIYDENGNYLDSQWYDA